MAWIWPTGGFIKVDGKKYEGQHCVGSYDPCPVCGAKVREVKCKVVCTKCKALVENCSGD